MTPLLVYAWRDLRPTAALRRGLGVRPRGRRELPWIKVAPKVQKARNPAGPLLSVPSAGLLLNFRSPTR
jgi:hypothetical protein